MVRDWEHGPRRPRSSPERGCWVDWGSDLGATECACVRKSKARLDKASAKLCGGAGCPPWRSGGGEMPACVARPTEGPTVYRCVRKRKRRSGRCSPCKVQAEMWRRGGRRRGPSGGARMESVTRSAQGLSGLLDGTARPKAVLREGYGGQGSPAARNCGGGGAYRRRRAAARRSCAVATARVCAAPAESDGGAGVRLGLRRAGPGIAAG